MRVWIAIWTGSGLICARIGAWIAGGPLARLIGLGLAAGFVKGLPWTTHIAYATGGAWLVTAIALGLHPPAQAEEKPSEQPALAPEKVTAAMHQLAAPHVQLAPLAEHLSTTTGDLRKVLTEMGVPIAGGVRMDGRGVSTGVKAEHIPPHSPAAAPASEGALTSDSNSNNAITVEHQAGMSIIRDPKDRARRTLLRRRS